MNTRTGDFSLSVVQAMNGLLVVALPLAAGLAFSWPLAKAVLVGALIANLSFLLLKNDLTGLMQGPAQAMKVRFFIKYYLRLSAVAVLLYFLVRYGRLSVLGLLVGLSTVVAAIVVAALSQIKNVYLSGKEAA
ncbi:MAG: ATP synthase subunit I [Desulfobacteraceae bacterium]|nr:ATP synthase subunit I [Desulfobacteraceae bacterium]